MSCIKEMKETCCSYCNMYFKNINMAYRLCTALKKFDIKNRPLNYRNRKHDLLTLER